MASVDLPADFATVDTDNLVDLIGTLYVIVKSLRLRINHYVHSGYVPTTDESQRPHTSFTVRPPFISASLLRQTFPADL